MNDEAKVLVALADHLRRAMTDIEKLVDQRAVVRIESLDGSVSVAVDAHGHLVWLRVAPGTTRRLPWEVLETVINETLATAAKAALAVEIARVS